MPACVNWAVMTNGSSITTHGNFGGRPPLLATPQLSRQQQAHNAQKFADLRQRARTDLLWLVNEVLAAPDSKIVTRAAHGIILDHCQKFTGRKEAVHLWKESKFGRPLIGVSTPVTPMWELPGSRTNMLLVSRGHLKTTINVVGHSIQWILNYPDVRILLVCSTEEKAHMMLKEIREHFQFNPRLRFLFPEFCPGDKKVSDFGSQSEFTVPNRVRRAKEPTMMTAAVGKALASTHHDVIKISDVVTENNIRTDGQVKEVKDFMGYLEPLRERGVSIDGKPNPGWKDVEGTIYHFADYYQMILDDEAKKSPEARAWRITKQSCWLDEAKTKPLWPERFPVAELHRIENSPEVGPVLFASQYELSPIRGTDGLASLDQIKFFPARMIKELLPRYRVHTTVDLANMDPNSNGDFTVLSTCGFDTDGRCDVLAIQRGHFTDEQIVNYFFAIQEVFPTNIDFKVQKDHFSASLKGYFQREQAKRQKWLNIVYTPTGARGSKTYRIIKGLQGWFMSGIIRFSDDLPCKNELILEILRFPKGRHDDILDTLADQFMNRDGEMSADVYPDPPKMEFGQGFGNFKLPQFQGFDPITMDQKWLHDQIESASAYYDALTGL